MGLNLVVPIEMIDYGRENPFDVVYLYRTLTTLDPGDYDGATYYFEVVGCNTEAVNRDIYLKINTTLYATITIPASTTVPTRFRSAAFSPAAGNYWIQLAYSPALYTLEVYSARIIIVQVNATKTRIQIPLTGRDGIEYLSNIPITDSKVGTTYGQGTAAYYSLFQKNVSKLADISSWKFECVLRAGATSYTAYASLFNKTDNTQVGGGVSTTLAYALLSETIVNDATNFHDLDEFEVRIKTSTSGGTAYISNAFLYIYLTNLSKAEIFLRVAKQCAAKTAADTFEECRAKVDINSYSVPTCYLEATGYCADNAERFDLQDDGTDDSGTAGASKVTNSGINFNSGTKARKRTTSAMTLTNGNRYWGNKVASTANGQWTNAFIVIQITFSDATAVITKLESVAALISANILFDFLHVVPSLDELVELQTPVVFGITLVTPSSLDTDTDILSPIITGTGLIVVSSLDGITELQPSTITGTALVILSSQDVVADILSPIITGTGLIVVSSLDELVELQTPTIIGTALIILLPLDTNVELQSSVVTGTALISLLPISLFAAPYVGNVVIDWSGLMGSIDILSELMPMTCHIMFERIELSSAVHQRLELDSVLR